MKMLFLLVILTACVNESHARADQVRSTSNPSLPSTESDLTELQLVEKIQQSCPKLQLPEAYVPVVASKSKTTPPSTAPQSPGSGQ